MDILLIKADHKRYMFFKFKCIKNFFIDFFFFFSGLMHNFLKIKLSLLLLCIIQNISTLFVFYHKGLLNEFAFNIHISVVHLILQAANYSKEKKI